MRPPPAGRVARDLDRVSTASAPELNRALRFPRAPGGGRRSCSHTSTVPLGTGSAANMQQVGRTGRPGAAPGWPPPRRRCRRRDGDAAAEVDQRVTVGVEQHAAPGRGDEDRQRGASASRTVELRLIRAREAGPGISVTEGTALRQLRAADGERGHDRTITSAACLTRTADQPAKGSQEVSRGQTRRLGP